MFSFTSKQYFGLRVQQCYCLKSLQNQSFRPCHQYHALHVPGAREHIERAAAQRGKSALFKNGEIPRESGGIAGHIDEPVRAGLRYGFYDLGRKSFARRIREYRIGCAEALCAFLCSQRGVAAHKQGVAVAPPVAPRVCRSVFHGFGHRFDPRQAASVGRGAYTYGAGAAVQIKQYVAGLYLRVLGGFKIKLFGYFRVHLIKRRRADIKAFAAQSIRKRPFAVQQERFRAEDDIGARGVDVEPHAFYGGKAL